MQNVKAVLAPPKLQQSRLLCTQREVVAHVIITRLVSQVMRLHGHLVGHLIELAITQQSAATEENRVEGVFGHGQQLPGLVFCQGAPRVGVARFPFPVGLDYVNHVPILHAEVERRLIAVERFTVKASADSVEGEALAVAQGYQELLQASTHLALEVDLFAVPDAGLETDARIGHAPCE
eukprot:scaffold83916_cov66-Phaeocystis_antarctica.AAC.1